MPNSIQQDIHGPDWPLGCIIVATPGTPVSIMSLVDPNGVNNPSTLVPPNTGTIPALTKEYTVLAKQILFQAYIPDPDNGGLMATQGNVYICRVPVGAGTGNRNDYGSIVGVIGSGQTFNLASGPADLNTWGPYRYYLDADNAGDGAIVTLILE